MAEDLKLIQLNNRFDDLKSCKKWLLISQMINHFNQTNYEKEKTNFIQSQKNNNRHMQMQQVRKIELYLESPTIRTPIDCNQRYALLKGFQMFDKQKHLRLNASNKKRQIELSQILQSEKKLFHFNLKLNDIEKRKKYLLFQKKLVPIQKRWIIILKYFLKFELFISIMNDIKLREKELKSQINAALTIQKWVRNKLSNKRKIRAAIYANYLKSILNICVINHKINQYNRSSNMLRLFFTTYINIYSSSSSNHDNHNLNTNYNPMWRVVNSFRNTIRVLQRFAKRLNAKKNAQCIIFAKQFIDYIEKNDETMNIKKQLKIDNKFNKSKEFTLCPNDKLILRVCFDIYIRKQQKYRSHLQSYFKQLNHYNENNINNNNNNNNNNIKKPLKPKYQLTLKKSDFEAMLIKTETYAKAVKSATRRGAMPGHL